MNEKILDILRNDTQLVGVLGKLCGADKESLDIPAVYCGSPKSWDVLPAVSFWQNECIDAAYADDVCFARLYVYQFDVYSRASVDNIFERMDFLLRLSGFTCKKVTNVIEPDCKHKRGIYSILKEEV